ncbi:MAG: hypothetical protein O3C61_07055, partial [Proteobacteria bacterium]|nr:hypothetical protein [Pseudomonadota bacterium]
MKILTFYHIYYKHRFLKSNIILKIYLTFVLPWRFFIYSIFLEKKINLDNLEINKSNLFNLRLIELFEYFNSDKGNFFFNQYTKSKKKERIQGHQYAIFYDKYFEDIKDNQLSILELGSFKGGATAAFCFFFKNSKIYSGDLYPDIFNFYSKRITNFKIDTSSEDSINNFVKNNNLEYDIIVEDAGHFLKDQIISLFLLFKKLKSKGTFIIEELDFPDTRQDMNIYNEKPTLREILYYVMSKQDFF